jgi:hypothetical protein
VSERAGALADDFATANQEAVAFTDSCTDAQWGAIVPGEEWPVGVVLHHIAEGHRNGLAWLELMAQGEAVTDTAAGIDQKNVEHAARASAISRGETARLLKENGAQLEALLRRLSDDQLDATAPFGPADGRAMPVSALAAVAARHVREHLGHARAAVEAGS